METNNEKGKEIFSNNPFQRIYYEYGAGVAYICVIDKNGDEHIGTCFHIGDSVFITARHVVENLKIKNIGTTVDQRRYYENEETKEKGLVDVELTFQATTSKDYTGPFFHPNPEIDVAAIILPGIKAPILPLGNHLDDWLGYEYMLTEAVVMGYPPIPFSSDPVLVATKGEVNAIIDKYTGGHPHFILSTMARGGFSGAPAITSDGIVLGVVSESLVSDNKPVELGYLSVMSVEGIFECISHNRIVPDHIDRQWDGFWNTEDFRLSKSSSEHISVDLYRGGAKDINIKVYCNFRDDIIQKAISILEASNKKFIPTWIHSQMVEFEFSDKSITLEDAELLFKQIIVMIEQLGIEQNYS